MRIQSTSAHFPGKVFAASSSYMSRHFPSWRGVTLYLIAVNRLFLFPKLSEFPQVLWTCWVDFLICLASTVASCEEYSWTFCVCVKYFPSFFRNLASASFIKCSLVLCIWGEKWGKVPCFLHTTQDLIHVIIYDVIFPFSPCFSGLKCSCLLGYCLYRGCFGFFAFISVLHSTSSNSAIYFLRWKGPIYTTVFKL